MKVKVKLKRDFNFDILEVEVPENVIREWVNDYQDTKGYWKYFYISKKGKKKECEINWVN